MAPPPPGTRGLAQGQNINISYWWQTPQSGGRRHLFFLLDCFKIPWTYCFKIPWTASRKKYATIEQPPVGLGLASVANGRWHFSSSARLTGGAYANFLLNQNKKMRYLLIQLSRRGDEGSNFQLVCFFLGSSIKRINMMFVDFFFSRALISLTWRQPAVSSVRRRGQFRTIPQRPGMGPNGFPVYGVGWLPTGVNKFVIVIIIGKT